MPGTKAETLQVPGAHLYWRSRGSGPVLLVLQGGDGDADGSDALGAELEGAFTVVTYDRRGLSRSTLEPGARVDVATHADDAHRLLAHVTREPAFVLGISIGALVGLELVSRHPAQVRRLVAHEPPASDFLPETLRPHFQRTQEDIEATFRGEGVMPAMRKFLALTKFDFTDREPQVAVPPPNPQRAKNLAFFLTHDAPSVREHRLDLTAFDAAAAKVVPALGASSRGAPHAAAVEALAKRLGRPAAEFPGGHGAYALRPKAFAARLREVLET